MLGGVIDRVTTGETLVLYDVFGYDAYLRLGMSVYTLAGETPRLLEERRYDYRYNRPVDPGYFSLP